MRLRTLSLLIPALGWCACASGPVPNERLETTAAAIRSADEIGATKVPRAALHLQLAKEESQHAKELVAAGDNVVASWTLARAQADAELALALARDDQERFEVQQAVERLNGISK
jgi:hypothetical protein